MYPLINYPVLFSSRIKELLADQFDYDVQVFKAEEDSSVSKLSLPVMAQQ